MAGLINFQDEKEVKEFLDNLGVEYRYQCYKEKDPEGKVCTVLSLYRTVTLCTLHTVHSGHCWVSPHAVFYYIIYVSGCQRLADYFEGVKKNYTQAAQVLKHNCESHGHGESCYKLGAYHVTGKGESLH